MGWIDEVKFDENGLIPVIAQLTNGKVVMFAWMNRQSLQLTLERKEAVYWSRSRQKLWHKGEESGHTQKVLSIKSDCDKDVLLLTIEQRGGIACHTGREGCFFNELQNEQWKITESVIKDPDTIYK